MLLRLAFLSLLLLAASDVRAEEKIVVGGSGGLVDEMEELAKIYMAKNPAEKIEVIPDPMSSTGGIEGVKNGRLTIGLVTLPPKGEGSLVYRPVGRVMVGVGVNQASPVAAISEAQICDVFSGKIKSWKDLGAAEGKITVVARKKDDANDAEMRHKISCFKDLTVTPDAIYVVRGSELMDAVHKRREVIALINGGSNLLERPNIKPLAIEGIPASIDAIRSGKYKFYNERGVITLGAPKGLAKRFLDFVATGESQKVLLQRGMIPVL
ncbi:MAG TPA: substrate-binding domain-containing protein [Verrucomicrobiae bacterium]|jgi:phosphate transport system substrate-binding protein|nr:substrate-binding domain-containing protein [Verrucomicrobiae bacterium]